MNSAKTRRVDDAPSAITQEEATALCRRAIDDASAATLAIAVKHNMDPRALILELMNRTAIRTRRGRLLAQSAPGFFKEVSDLVKFEDPESSELFRAGSLEGAVVTIDLLAKLLVRLSHDVAEVNMATYAAYCYFEWRSFDVHPDLELLLGPRQ